MERGPTMLGHGDGSTCFELHKHPSGMEGSRVNNSVCSGPEWGAVKKEEEHSYL